MLMGSLGIALGRLGAHRRGFECAEDDFLCFGDGFWCSRDGLGAHRGCIEVCEDGFWRDFVSVLR